MASHKRSARAKKISQFEAELDDQNSAARLDTLFMDEEKRRQKEIDRRERALRYKACESKNRYDTQWEAEAARLSSSEHGVANLRVYRCRYCNGWHLTSKPPMPEKSE